MPNKRFILSAVVLLGFSGAPGSIFAQDPGGAPPSAGSRSLVRPKPPAATTPAETVLDEAIVKLRNRPHAAADITMQADMLNERFRVVGRYLKAPNYRSLLRLTVEGLSEVQATTQQVSDGTTLFNLSQAYDEQRISVVQLGPILKALDNPDADDEFREAILSTMGFSGPEALIEGLRSVATFDQGMAEEEYEGRPVYIMRGQWRDRESLGLSQANATPQGIRIGFLPPYVPSQIGLWIDRENGWPLKLVMEGKVSSVLKDEPVLDPTGRPIAKKTTKMKERPSRLTLTYTLTDREVAPEEFQFRVPENVRIEDLTDNMTAAIEAQLSDLSARRRNQEADPNGGRLEPLNAPRPSGAGGPGQSPSPAPAPGAAPAVDPPQSSNSPR